MVERVQIGDATLYLGDCRDLMDEVAGADLALIDGPYGIEYRHRGGGATLRSGRASGAAIERRTEGVIGDDEPFDPSPWLAFPKVILWGANYFCNRLPPSPSWIYWDKRDGMDSNSFADGELAWTNLGGPLRQFSYLWNGICRAGEKERRVHPMQKPVALMAWCIEQAKLKPSALVVDGYMGSAPVGIACVRAGLRYIGVEKDPKHFATACARIEAAYREPNMFASPPAVKPVQVSMFDAESAA